MTMRILFALLSVAALASGLRLAPLYKAPEKTSDRHIVVLEDHVDIDEFTGKFVDAAALFKNRPFIVRKLRTAINAVIVDMKDEVVELVRSLDGVDFVEEDLIAYLDYEEEPASIFADYYNWGVDRINQRDLPRDGNIDVPSGYGANIYIIDTGIRVTHDDFKDSLGRSRAINAANFVDNAADGDCSGHGTHCAGIAAGSQFGVAYAANIHDVKVMDCEESSSTSGMISGIDFVAQEKKNGKKHVVASMSLSFNSNSFSRAVSNAISDGVVAITSSGNDNYNACNKVPGNIDEVITVGNTQSDDSIRESSNYGTCVDILAPGTSITSCGITSDSSTSTKSGTSMACPHVAGAAAILMADRDCEPSWVEDWIKYEATLDRISGLRPGTPNELLYVRRPSKIQSRPPRREIN